MTRTFGRDAIGAAASALALVIVAAVSGCTEGDDSAERCAVGTDPMPVMTVSGMRGDGAFPGELLGAIEVRDLELLPEGGTAFTRWFVDDATGLTVELAVAGDPPLPFAEGDQLQGRATYAQPAQYINPSWRHVSLELEDGLGTLLLDYYTAELRPAVRPPECWPDRFCYTWVGLVPARREFDGCVRHPDDPAGDVYEGESLRLSCADGEYRYYLMAHHAYAVDPGDYPTGCSDLPLGWQASLLLRFPEGWLD